MRHMEMGQVKMRLLKMRTAENTAWCFVSPSVANHVAAPVIGERTKDRERAMPETSDPFFSPRTEETRLMAMK